MFLATQQGGFRPFGHDAMKARSREAWIYGGSTLCASTDPNFNTARRLNLLFRFPMAHGSRAFTSKNS